VTGSEVSAGGGADEGEVLHAGHAILLLEIRSETNRARGEGGEEGQKKVSLWRLFHQAQSTTRETLFAPIPSFFLP